MRSLLFLLAFISSYSFAGFEKISVTNLNLSYEAPYGEGTIDKVGLGYSLKDVEVPYKISLERTDHSFDITSDFLDFSWIHPYKFFYKMEKFSTRKMNFAMGGSTHHLESEQVFMVPEGRGEYLGSKIKAQCKGSATGEMKVRVLEDCKTNLDASIKRIEVPADFILYQILYEIPRVPTEADISGDNFVLTSRDGQFNMQLYIKYYVYAGLRAHGYFQYEDNHETIAINIKQIKFGFLSVTNFVMRRLQVVIKSPNVKIDPPWIRINIGKPNEDR